MHGLMGVQHDDPALNDAILRRYPDAAALLGVCDRSTALGQHLVRESHADGSLSLDFTEADLFSLPWLAGTASRDESAPLGWVRIVNRALDSAWTE